MNTTIMNIALKLAGFGDVPGDSEIFTRGENNHEIDLFTYHLDETSPRRKVDDGK